MSHFVIEKAFAVSKNGDVKAFFLSEDDAKDYQ